MLTFGSLFSGIGGIDLGLERAGMTCKWQVEIDDYCTRVLSKHWPDVPKFRDVREVGAHNLPRVDVIAGGFPCQDVSLAGKRAGLDGERSGLWSEFARLLRVLRPRYALIENVPGLLTSGLDTVLCDIAALGLDAEWDCLPASAFGAYHERDRLFVVAYPANLDGNTRYLLEESESGRAQLQSRRLHSMAVATRGQSRNERLEREPRLARLVSRVPHRTQRLEAGGNSVVPQVAEWIGRRIIQHDTTGGLHPASVNKPAN